MWRGGYLVLTIYIRLLEGINNIGNYTLGCDQLMKCGQCGVRAIINVRAVLFLFKTASICTLGGDLNNGD